MPHRMAFWKPMPGANPYERSPDGSYAGTEWLDSVRVGQPVEKLDAVPTNDVSARLRKVFPDAVSTKTTALDWSCDTGAWTAHGHTQGVEVVLWDDVPDEVLNRLIEVFNGYGLQHFSYPQ